MNSLPFTSFFIIQSVQPLLRDPTHVITTTTQSELLTCLKTAVLGISSRLYVWDSNLERFLQTGTENHAKAGIILVDGKDTVLTERFVEFINPE